MRQEWTDAANTYLREAWEKRGLSASQCADALGRDLDFFVTRNAVIGRVARLGLSARKMQNLRVPKPKAPRVSRVVAEARAARPRSRSHIKAIKPEPPPPPPRLPDDRKGVPFLDMRPGQCRWPLWRDSTPFEAKEICGEPAMPGKSYCPACSSVSIAPKVSREPVKEAA